MISFIIVQRPKKVIITVFILIIFGAINQAKLYLKKPYEINDSEYCDNISIEKGARLVASWSSLGGGETIIRLQSMTTTNTMDTKILLSNLLG